ncbi:iron complex transport system ATP-binding protein [Methanofollis sp. W23]|uniref:ABC transporter ATP-binding protein n=1 Tax=Methanofollis sp. W23 TaxID=2817849 RepID=UPI001AE6A2C7|nr:ABC transporter ATP-binding protein [Methanofollis sp. W23]MBP2146426.1 iron complex transport system ATP-binding protein [Methanofollis sp. W23]
MILTVRDASFSYDGTRTIFEGVSFSVDRGECLCILGPNGTGKSTLIKCLINVLPLDVGTITLNDTEITSLSRTEVAQQIAYVPQAHQIVFPFDVIDFVLMGRAPHLSLFASPGRADQHIAEDALVTVGIDHLAHRPVSEISGGELQLALIARALAQQPAVMVLDEPTSHLDFGNQVRVLRLIERLAEEGIAVVMTSHFPDHSFIIPQNVAIMKDGGFIAVGPAKEVLTPGHLSKAYGIDVAISYVEEAGRMACIPSVCRTP